MQCESVLQLLVLACLVSAPATGAEFYRHLMTVPQSPVVEIGTNFTATCTIINTTEVTASDLIWNLTKMTIPREQYTKINSTALNVTIPITSETPNLLICQCKKKSFYLQMNEARFQHGIFLKKGYRPEKPENVTCIAVQEKSVISSTIKCQWDAAGPQTEAVPTRYTLFVKHSGVTYNGSTPANNAQVTMEIFPNHVFLDIWVEASNKLGRVESEHLNNDANSFVKTNPPSDVRVISEQSFPSSLLINWTHPIRKEYLRLIYQIRFCPHRSHSWIYVPLGDTSKDIQSFRLQNLQPDSVYATQVRCKYDKEELGYWSDWSTNATKRTPEGRPSSKADIWRTITEGGRNERQVQFVCKDPVSANGRIKRFNIRIQNQKDKVKNGSLEWESIPVNRSEVDNSSGQREITFLKEILLPEDKFVKVYVTAFNSVGKSPEASLGVPAKAHEYDPMQELRVWPKGNQLWVEWTTLNSTDVSEYVVEWVHGGQMDWQRESTTTRCTTIKGALEKFTCYDVSVYPLYTGWIGKPAHTRAYLEEGAPSQAPETSLKGDPGRNEATLVWQETLEPSRRGFITHYVLFYANEPDIHKIMLPANATSYTLSSLLANTKYDIWIEASTLGGSKNGSKSSFTTLKYAPGEIEGIVIGVSLGFLFIFLITILLCLYKRDVIKKNLWPQIPNPGESTIGNWSPDYPLKAETPRENCLSGISVLDVDMCDAKCLFEEDKTSPALKKDKYLSEEHSSGIGGSSCMSSPRQSVSDSDEGGDLADTTASTVQYSSVVASSGYKGQMPTVHPQQALFSRSESTQPLLDSEENSDMQEGSRRSQGFSTSPRFPHADNNPNQLDMEEQDCPESLHFCPLKEDVEQMEWYPATPGSSYMPQLGYRRQ